MSSQSAVLQVRWPLKMSPGDERMLSDALTLGDTGGRLFVRFLFDADVRVVGASNLDDQTVVIDSRVTQKVAIKFCIDKDARVGSKKDVAMVLYRRRTVLWRAALAATMVCVAVVPTVLYALDARLLGFNVTFAGIALFSAPLLMLLGVAFGWRRISVVLEWLRKDSLVHDYPVAIEGARLGSIEIQAQSSESSIGLWSPEGLQG